MSRNDQGLVGLPFALYPAALEWNAALFEKAKLQAPPAKIGERYTLPDGSQADWDWETLAKVAQLLTLDTNGRNAAQPAFDAAHIAQYGFSWGHETHPALTASFWQTGWLLAPDGSPGSYQVSIPAAWRSAWEWTYNGMRGPQPFIAFGPAAAVSFENGQTAMTIETTRYLSSLGKVKFQFAALPTYNGQVSHRLDVESFRLWKGSKNRDAAFLVLTYLVDQGAHKLLVECHGFPPAYDAVPVRGSDRQAFVDFREKQFPWVNTWDTLLAATNNPETPADEGHMPNFTEAWARIAAFGTRLETVRDLDLAAEEASLERDLTELFNKP
jgi:multiple sugar transport system substrate-binding protein